MSGSSAPRGHPPSAECTVIEARKGWENLDLRDLFGYAELLYFLTWRDIKVRYKQASLGVAWAILQPVLTMIVFSVVFGRLAGLPSDGTPYPVFSLAALLPWQLFAGSLQRAGTSLVGNANLITKVYFPRLIIPLAAVAACLFDFVIALAVLAALMAWYGIRLTPAILTLPLFVLAALLAALAVSLWLSALNVKYRDVQHALPFIVQLWMFASPVAYSSSLIPGGFWSIVYSVNPMAGVIQGFRWALLNGPAPGLPFVISMLACVFLLISGLLYFKRTERYFADVI